jgi:hypothetical protein
MNPHFKSQNPKFWMDQKFKVKNQDAKRNLFWETTFTMQSWTSKQLLNPAG